MHLQNESFTCRYLCRLGYGNVLTVVWYSNQPFSITYHRKQCSSFEKREINSRSEGHAGCIEHIEMFWTFVIRTETGRHMKDLLNKLILWVRVRIVGEKNSTLTETQILHRINSYIRKGKKELLVQWNEQPGEK